MLPHQMQTEHKALSTNIKYSTKKGKWSFLQQKEEDNQVITTAYIFKETK
jgi:hypothetical protein